MAMNKDWSKEKLLILPFDHRGTFLKKMFNVTDRKEFTEEETEIVMKCKWIVYQGFLKALKEGTATKEEAGILVDKQFGEKIIADAHEKGITFALSSEKSGQKEFDFEYGEKYSAVIEEVKPTLAKVLVRYNPAGEKEMNERQAARLKQMNDYLATTNIAYLFELLMPATEEQMASVENDHERYDKELRPGLMIAAIKELHTKGVEPDVWKLEGVDTKEDAQAIVDACHEGGKHAGVIILGRGADNVAVEHWLKVGASVEGAIGFAVGRTIFWNAIDKYYKKEFSEEEAIAEVCENYSHFVKVWKGE